MDSVVDMVGPQAGADSDNILQHPGKKEIESKSAFSATENNVVMCTIRICQVETENKEAPADNRQHTNPIWKGRYYSLGQDIPKLVEDSRDMQ